MHRVLLPFEFSEPDTVAEAVALIDGDRARALAGGVDLVLRMRLRQIVPQRVVSLQKVPGLDYVRVDGPSGGPAGAAAGRAEPGGPGGRTEPAALRIGALATLHQVETSPSVRQNWLLLAEALRSIVSVQTKIMGTLAGNLCTGSPASDVAPALYALGAAAKIVGLDGEREIPVEQFFLDAGKTAVGPHEIVTEIVVPAPAAGSAGAFLKLAKTSEDIAKVNVAVVVVLSGGVVVRSAISIGSVAPTPMRAAAAEQALVGRSLSAQVIAEAADAAAGAACPISDVRSTARYRQQMVRVLVRDALAKAAARADGGEG